MSYSRPARTVTAPRAWADAAHQAAANVVTRQTLPVAQVQSSTMVHENGEEPAISVALAPCPPVADGEEDSGSTTENIHDSIGT
jgi:hypothetical protein